MDQEKELFIRKVRSVLSLDSVQTNDQSGQLRPAAVLLPLFYDHGLWKLLFIRRSNFGEFHRGEVAFPGGAKEIVDQDMTTTAKRETQEELGISPEFINILGSIEPLSTISNYFVTPVVGVLSWPTKIEQNPREVSRVFSIPLQWLSDTKNWGIKEFEISGRGKISTIVYSPYDNETVWGFTAKVTVNFLQRLKNERQ